jgi:hypothetical protein
MLIFQHRVNDLAALAATPAGLGIELDVRYHDQRLVLAHDPFHHPGLTIELDALLRAGARERHLIVNLKSEGIERACSDLLASHGVRDWFFLDTSLPALVRLSTGSGSSRLGREHLCARFSEHEPADLALGLAAGVGWVWVDCFTKLPLTKALAERFAAAHQRICLVSPELQGHPLERIAEFREGLRGVPVDAVCTKRPDLWGPC